MSKDDKIITMIPAAPGHWAVYKYDEGGLFATPVDAWALVEYNLNREGQRPDMRRSVVGMVSHGEGTLDEFDSIGNHFVGTFRASSEADALALGQAEVDQRDAE